MVFLESFFAAVRELIIMFDKQSGRVEDCEGAVWVGGTVEPNRPGQKILSCTAGADLREKDTPLSALVFAVVPLFAFAGWGGRPRRIFAPLVLTRYGFPQNALPRGLARDCLVFWIC